MKSTQTLTTDSNHTNVNKDVLIGEIGKGGGGEGTIQDGFDGFVDGIKAIPGNIVNQFKGLYSLKDADVREEVFNNFIYLATLSTEEKSKLWDDIRNSDYEKAKFTSSLLGEAYLMSGVSKLVSLSKNSVVNYFDDVSQGTAKDGPVIVGETMKRVESAAEGFVDAKILNDMPEYWNMGLKDYEVTSKMMEYNRKWILEQFRSGRDIIDIGLDVNRKTPSVFYQMEQNMIKNYQKLHDLNVIRP